MAVGEAGLQFLVALVPVAVDINLASESVIIHIQHTMESGVLEMQQRYSHVILGPAQVQYIPYACRN